MQSSAYIHDSIYTHMHVCIPIYISVFVYFIHTRINIVNNVVYAMYSIRSTPKVAAAPSVAIAVAAALARAVATAAALAI